MKHNILLPFTVALFSLFTAVDRAYAQSTAFTYQGRLNNNGAPANGSYDLQFALFDAATGGSQVGGTLTATGAAVSNGLFTATLDFGTGVFPGADRWPNILVRTNGAVSFTVLTPRQQVNSTPYAVQALGAGSAATVTGNVSA